MVKRFVVLAGFLILGSPFLVGCGSGEKVTKIAVPPAVEQMRTTLKQIAEAGAIDSSVGYVQDLAAEIAAEDPSKTGLVEATKELEKARGKSGIQKQVDAILKMLDG